ncbi:hypothetical protein N7530_004922 [Penicillium desertorum]|uniref:Uncharacterized protein n=1 Tax=Penicillium desertorum TaxID=1303715 RepID=A0A9W9WZ56_9EURO|nr:hypothetical protein N7530_004922 [Penicillium desertorum]
MCKVPPKNDYNNPTGAMALLSPIQYTIISIMTTMELYHSLDNEAPAPKLVRQQWEPGSGMSRIGGGWR